MAAVGEYDGIQLCKNSEIFVSCFFHFQERRFFYADKLQESKRVLLIQSYHNTFRWTNQVTQGFLNRMEHLAPNTEIEVIYLDLLRKGSQKKTKLEKAVRKIRQGFFDLVVVSGDDGIDLFRACAGEIPQNSRFCSLDGSIRTPRSGRTSRIPPSWSRRPISKEPCGLPRRV